MDYKEIANTPAMWIASSFIVLVLVFQAIIFITKARKVARSLAITDSQVKVAMRTAAISSIGPSFAVALAMLSLMVSLGAPFAWMRLSVIGSVPYELFAASSAAQASGTEIGSDSFSVQAYINVVWTCTLGALGWLLIVMIFAHRFDDIRTRVVKGRTEILPALSTGAMIGAVCYFSAPSLMKNLPSVVAFLTSGVLILILSQVGKKLNKPWMSDWAFGVAIFVGMFTAVLFK